MCYSHFKNVIYGTNTGKKFKSEEQNPKGEQSIVSKCHTNLSWISYCSEYHFAKLNYETEKFES